MAYDKQLADQMRLLLEGHAGLSEMKMFGGLCFLIHGNMCCGILGSDLILRLGVGGAAEGLRLPHTRLFDGAGRPMQSMLSVEQAGYRDPDALAAWLQRALRFAASLPRKKG